MQTLFNRVLMYSEFPRNANTCQMEERLYFVQTLPKIVSFQKNYIINNSNAAASVCNKTRCMSLDSSCHNNSNSSCK